MSEFKAIAAVAENGVIGSGLSIPWHISEDFKHFKKRPSEDVAMGGALGKASAASRFRTARTS